MGRANENGHPRLDARTSQVNLFLTKLAPSGHRRIHAAHMEKSRPLCGGGNGGRSVQWQQDIGPCDCAACRAIQARNPESFTPPPANFQQRQ
jgi:hypothetical protein